MATAPRRPRASGGARRARASTLCGAARAALARGHRGARRRAAPRPARAAGACPLAALAAPALGSRAAVRLALAGAVVAGALVAQARLEAIDATRLAPRIGHAVRERVVLLDAPRARSFGVRVATVRLDGERVLLRAGRGVRWPTERVGAVLAARGGLEPLPPSDAWQRARGVHAELRAEALADTGRGAEGSRGSSTASGRARRRSCALASRRPRPPCCAAWPSATTRALPDRTRDEFRALGLSHLVAASGQNVMLLAALVLGVAAVLGLALRARLALVLGAIALYVPLAGGGPSIQRAGVMGAAASSPRWPAARRPLARAAAGGRGHAGAQPAAVEDAGWQLSFAAVVAILLLAGRVRDGLVRARAAARPRRGDGAHRRGDAGDRAAHRGALRPGLAGLAAGQRAGRARRGAGHVAGDDRRRAGQVGTALAAPFVALAAFPLAYVMWVAHVAGGAPGARASVPAGVGGAACAAAAWRCSCPARGRRWPWRGGGAGAVARWRCARRAAAAGSLARRWPAGRAGLARVGRRARAARRAADHLPRRRPGRRDADPAGGAARSSSTPGPPDGPILTRLRHAGRAAAGPAGGHPRPGRPRRRRGGGAARGARSASSSTGATASAIPAARAWRRRPRARGVRTMAGRAGEVLRVGAIALRVLWPASARGPADAGADPNQRAIVAEADAGGVRALLTADAESDVLAGLDLGPVDVLKVSHHGSADPGLPRSCGACDRGSRRSRSGATTSMAIRAAATVACAPRGGRRASCAPTATAA